nr:protein downy mildew resistance 6 [Quercus suber]
MEKLILESSGIGWPLGEVEVVYSDDPSKTWRLSTSFNANKEKVHNWRDYLGLHCCPLDKYVPEWPSNPTDFKQESDRSRLSEFSACDDVPVIDLGLEDRTQVVKQIAESANPMAFFR